MIDSNEGRDVAPSDALTRREAQIERHPGNPNLLGELANTLTVLASLHVATDDWTNACANAERIKSVWRQYDELQSALMDVDQLEREGNRGLFTQCAKRGFSWGLRSYPEVSPKLQAPIVARSKSDELWNPLTPHRR